MSSLREKAEEIIEGYARGHAGTAVVAGQLGGQFGTDKIPLNQPTRDGDTEIAIKTNLPETAADSFLVGLTKPRQIYVFALLTHQTLDRPSYDMLVMIPFNSLVLSYYR